MPDMTPRLVWKLWILEVFEGVEGTKAACPQYVPRSGAVAIGLLTYDLIVLMVTSPIIVWV